MKKIKIAYLIGSLTCGGAEKQVITIVNSIDRRLFEPYLIVLWSNFDLISNINPKIKIYSLQFRKRYFFIGFTKLIYFIMRNKIDIIHSHMYSSNLIASAVRYINPGCILLTGEHGKNNWKKPIHHLIEQKIISKKAILRIAASKDIKNLRIKYDGADPSKIIYVPNGTKIPRYGCNNNKKPTIVGFLGRLEAVKDVPTIILALGVILKKGYDLKLKIAGQGSESIRIKEFIKLHGLEDNVDLVGFQDSGIFLKKIDVFVMASLREGVPLSLLEAMAHGLPCVATNVGGIPDVISHEKNGLLVSPRNSKELAKSIVRYVEDRNFRVNIGTCAKKTIAHNYSFEKIGNTYSKIYRNIYRNEKI